MPVALRRRRRHCEGKQGRECMQLASLAGGLLVVLGGVAQAAEGDDLVGTGNGVNVRA